MTANQWNKVQQNPASWASNNAVPSSFSSSPLPADSFQPVNGLTRYSLYDDPLVLYDQNFPYDGAIVAVTSQYGNSNVAIAPPSSWSTQ